MTESGGASLSINIIISITLKTDPRLVECPHILVRFPPSLKQLVKYLVILSLWPRTSIGTFTVTCMMM